jgi:hypothetical protein
VSAVHTPRRAQKENRQIVTVVLLVGLLFTSAIAYLIVKPDRETCRNAINTEVTRALMEDKDVTTWATEHDAEVKKRLRWPCRFQSDIEMKTIASEVLGARWQELLAKGLEEAFN